MSRASRPVSARGAAPLPDDSAVGADADDRITLNVDFDGENHATFVVLGLGPRVEVIAPPALRARVAAEIAAMFRQSR